MEYLHTPVGRVATPPEAADPGYAEMTSVHWQGDAVVLTFWRNAGIGDDPAVVGVAAARIFMTKTDFERTPKMLQTMIDMWEERDRAPE